ncbi:MAG: saccharopine dehydrogenase C-terminal domain-containing protein, partial [Gemmatimonadota bacterium]
MKKVVVLGAGRVGGAIIRDLAATGEFEVTAADASAEALARLEGTPRVATVQADLSDPAALGRVLERQDLVVGAVPGFMGFETLRRALEAGKDVVDISFFPEDPFELDALAREKGRIALVDCGVAPGCSNLILGRLEAALDSTERFVCMVGGLPVERRWPYEYKAPFSPIDVIEEYTRPARFRRDGKDVVMPALSEIELVDIPGVGTLEAFNTDGLRTLLRTCRTPSMVEKTLRYPGHAERMRMLRETGFFDVDPIEVGGVRVRPIDVTARLLFDAWMLRPGEQDLTVMRVEVEGTKDGKRVRHVYTLLDRYDERTGIHSMARTTGYTCTAMVRLVARGMFREPGVLPPEIVGRDEACFDFIMSELAARGVVF